MEQDKRKLLIKLIHVAKRELAMDDDTYRGILLSIGNVNSSSKLSISKLELVLEHFKQAGFKIVPNKAGNLKRANDPQSKKIRALWLQLYDLGAVKNPSEYSLSLYAKRITGVSHLSWLSSDQSSQIIETLKRWIQRMEKEHAAKKQNA